MSRAAFLRRLRADRGLKQHDVTGPAGVALNSLSYLEQERHDDRQPRDRVSLAMLRVFNEAQPLTAAELEQYRKHFGLRPQQIADVLRPIDLPMPDKDAPPDEFTASIAADAARMSMFIGPNLAATIVRLIADAVELAATRAANDEAESRLIAVRHPPEPAEDIAPGATVERYTHHRVDPTQAHGPKPQAHGPGSVGLGPNPKASPEANIAPDRQSVLDELTNAIAAIQRSGELPTTESERIARALRDAASKIG
ncbi:MAG: helix-turn-helix transcriptional regulator [Planctomycetota bacterium]